MAVKFLQKTKNGIESFQLSNGNGVVVEVITYGARISKIVLPTANGNIDVVAGFDNPDDFMGDNPYFNAVIGRVANRIGNAQFELNGKVYHLYKNDGENCLHGGKLGFDRRMWQGEIFGNSVKMSRLSPDMEEGFPGNLQVSVTYTLQEDNSLKIEYCAQCDVDTVCSLTNHAYFNLDGDFESALNHQVYINSSALTVFDQSLITNGKLLNLDNTPYDFRQPKTIGKDISKDATLLKIAGGYDFNYVLDNDKISPVAWAYSQKSGVKMSVYTDRPCMQLYTGNFLDGLKGKKVYGFQSAFCMETQGYPNACNVNCFDTMTLKAGQKFESYTTYKFEF